MSKCKLSDVLPGYYMEVYGDLETALKVVEYGPVIPECFSDKFNQKQWLSDHKAEYEKEADKRKAAIEGKDEDGSLSITIPGTGITITKAKDADSE